MTWLPSESRNSARSYRKKESSRSRSGTNSGFSATVTLRKTGEEATCDPAELLARASRNLENAYRGVVIPSDEVRGHWLRTGRAGGLLQDPDMLVKIMRRGLPRSWGRAVP